MASVRSAAGAQPDLRPHDERYMRMALAIGARHLGLTWPNPSVGAVVVDESGPEPVIVAQGVTQPGGRPHAERVALEMAGERARGATLYVSLEPCSHHGRTPPCIDAVRDYGVARVVTALEDPDTRVSGRGHAILREAGVAVLCGVLAGEATRAHRGHILRVTQGRPSVLLKLARTADGYAARKGGGRLMISGPRSNARTHLIRARHDAIMVGIGTVLADDPLLTVRLPGLEPRSPVRVVIDSALRTPADAQIVRTASQIPTWIVAAEEAPVEAERRLVAAGAEVMRASSRAGRVAIEEALRLLATRGITRVFSEGGPNLAEALIEADCVDEFATTTSRTALGEDGLPAIGPRLSQALPGRFVRVSSEDLGPDVLEFYERVR